MRSSHTFSIASFLRPNVKMIIEASDALCSSQSLHGYRWLRTRGRFGICFVPQYLRKLGFVWTVSIVDQVLHLRVFCFYIILNLLCEFFESIDEVGRFVSLTYLSEVWKLLLAYARDDATLKLGGVWIEPCLLLVAELRLVAIARREASWRLRLIDKSTSLVF